jgi:hypothetical protein
MKLHNTLVEVLIKTYEVNSGWTEERKLREALSRLDVSVYTQQDGTKVLVSTKELYQHTKAFELAEAQKRGE